MNSIFMKLSHDFRSHTSEIWIFEVIFVDFKTDEYFFNKTEVSYKHARQIFGSKSNKLCIVDFCSEITMIKKKLNVCSAHSYTHGPGLS